MRVILVILVILLIVAFIAACISKIEPEPQCSYKFEVTLVNGMTVYNTYWLPCGSTFTIETHRGSYQLTTRSGIRLRAGAIDYELLNSGTDTVPIELIK